MIAAFFGRAVDGKDLVDRLAIAGVCWVNGYKNREKSAHQNPHVKLHYLTLSYRKIP